MQALVMLEAPWRDPVQAFATLADEPWAIAFHAGDWAYVAAEPDAACVLAATDHDDPFAKLADLLGPTGPGAPGGPPFQGGVAGLLGYELADRIEGLGLARLARWPDLACARYPALLAFDQSTRRLLALGRGGDEAAAGARARQALNWLARPMRAAAAVRADVEADDPADYERAVAEVVRRIAAGDVFQANIARRWRGRLLGKTHPFDLFASLTSASPAPFSAYLRLPDRAVVSNSPERFVEARRDEAGLAARTEPIKGTARRSADPVEDARLAAALAASPKDRAENLMIVDLMRNDLSRVCPAGEVAAPELFRLASFANVHHLVSTVTGRLATGRTVLDLLRACFPPGSITGAPKVQAMKLIAELEAPRGPFFGSLVQLGFDGGLESNVLIRTCAFTFSHGEWRLEARAGAGIVADSDPRREREETEAKVSALLRALGVRP